MKMLSAQDAIKLTVDSRIDHILEAIEGEAKKGRRSLMVAYAAEFGGGLEWTYAHDDDTLNHIKSLGFSINKVCVPETTFNKSYCKSVSIVW